MSCLPPSRCFSLQEGITALKTLQTTTCSGMDKIHLLAG